MKIEIIKLDVIQKTGTDPKAPNMKGHNRKTLMENKL